MARMKPMFRVFAVVNAVLLLGLYVAYRGGVVQAFGSKTPEQPVQGDPPPVVVADPPRVELPTAVPQNAEKLPENKAASTAQPAAKPAVRTHLPPELEAGFRDILESEKPAVTVRKRTEIMPGSKSSGFRFLDDEKPSETKRTELLSGSKSSLIVIIDRAKDVTVPLSSLPENSLFEEVKPTAAPTPSNEPVLQPRPRHVILGGSKSLSRFLPEEPARQPAPAPAAAQRQESAAPLTPEQRRVLMKSSKSGRVELLPDQQ